MSEPYWWIASDDIQTLHTPQGLGAPDRVVGWIIRFPGGDETWSAVLNDGTPSGHTLARNVTMAAAKEMVEAPL